MARILVFVLLACTGLTACSGKFNEMRIKAQLSTPQRSQYAQIVEAFVDQCVKKSDAKQSSVAGLYFIEKSEQSCILKTDTYYDDDTVIAALLTKELKRADPRFRVLSKRGLFGAAWKIGKGSAWSYTDGTPLVSLGRKSSKSVLRIRRFGYSL